MGNTASSITKHIPLVNSFVKQDSGEFKVHIAVDFGTDGCGLAFAYKDKVTVYNKWKAKKRHRVLKAKTHILLDDKNEIAAFGNSAKAIYSNLTGTEKTQWKFFERFKMSLYGNDFCGDDEKKIDDVKTTDSLIAINGATCPAEIVFVAAFQKVREIATKHLCKLTNNEIRISADEIQWIVTVPAIWSESAKNKMKKWIIQAGLVNENIKDQCLIVYEPDCAALAMFKEIEQKKDIDTQLTTYILIDAGGGTVDIASHKTTEDGGLEEIVCPGGGNWGSCYIDDKFIILLKDIFSEEWIDEYKRIAPNVYLEIIHNFQNAKSSFFEDVNLLTHNVELPYEFVQFLHEKCRTTQVNLEDICNSFSKPFKYFCDLFQVTPINNFDDDNKEHAVNDDDIVCTMKLISDVDDYLEIDVNIWKCLFDSQINHILNHVHKLLNMKILKSECKYLYLIGGFSASNYFQQKMKKEFEYSAKYKREVIIPQTPALSVVIGAAYFGITKNFIKARRLKCTYGILLARSEAEAQKRGIPLHHIKHNKANDGGIINCVQVIARKNERIMANDVKTHVVYSRQLCTVGVPIFCSMKENPIISADGNISATLSVFGCKKGENVVIEFYFYSTIITVKAYKKMDPTSKRTVEIEYE